MRREARKANLSHKDCSPAITQSEPSWTPFHDSRPLQRENRRSRHIRRRRSRGGRIDGDRRLSRSRRRRTRDPSQCRPHSRSCSRRRQAKHPPRVPPRNGRIRSRDNHERGRRTGTTPRNGLCYPGEKLRDSRSFSRYEKSPFCVSEATHAFPGAEMTPRNPTQQNRRTYIHDGPRHKQERTGGYKWPTTASVAPARHPGRTPGERALLVASISPPILGGVHGTSMHLLFHPMRRVGTDA